MISCSSLGLCESQPSVREGLCCFKCFHCIGRELWEVVLLQALSLIPSAKHPGLHWIKSGRHWGGVGDISKESELMLGVEKVNYLEKKLIAKVWKRQILGKQTWGTVKAGI